MKYALRKACERVSPMDLFGKSLNELDAEQLADLMSFDLVRSLETRG